MTTQKPSPGLPPPVSGPHVGRVVVGGNHTTTSNNKSREPSSGSATTAEALLEHVQLTSFAPSPCLGRTMAVKGGKGCRGHRLFIPAAMGRCKTRLSKQEEGLEKGKCGGEGRPSARPHSNTNSNKELVTGLTTGSPAG